MATVHARFVTAPVRPVRIGARTRYRLNVAARTAAGTIGAYALAALFAFAGARLWPADPMQAVIPPTLLAFLVMPAATLWSFLARTPGRAWAGLGIVAALFAAGGWIAGPHG